MRLNLSILVKVKIIFMILTMMRRRLLLWLPFEVHHNIYLLFFGKHMWLREIPGSLSTIYISQMYSVRGSCWLSSHLWRKSLDSTQKRQRLMGRNLLEITSRSWRKCTLLTSHNWWDYYYGLKSLTGQVFAKFKPCSTRENSTTKRKGNHWMSSSNYTTTTTVTSAKVWSLLQTLLL